jgi:hypothetical protein
VTKWIFWTGRTASVAGIKTDREEAEQISPGIRLIRLIWDLWEFFGAAPEVLRSGKGGRVNFFFRDSCAAYPDLIRVFGTGIARICEDWPLCLFATAAETETCRITAALGNDGVECRMETISGKAYEILNDICLCADCGSEAAACLEEAFGTPARTEYCHAVSRRHWDFLRREGIPCCAAGTLYCYFCRQPEDPEAPGAFLRTLSLEKKVSLWKEALADGMDLREFEWLYERYEKGIFVNLMEWELALQEAMEDLSYRLVNDGRFFAVEGKKHRRTFDFEQGTAAEKMFLKILFPVVRKPDQASERKC